MTMLDPQHSEQLRQGFRYLNRFMLALWRLGLGGWVNAWPEQGGRIMVLTQTGFKSGLKRKTPLNYAIVDEEIYCLSGFGSSSDWYRNIRKDPQVQVWLPDGWWCGMAEEVSTHPARIPILREVILASGVVGRMFGFDVTRMSDQELDAATIAYRLVHIKRTAALTGPGGPGDLAWVWPVATFVLLVLELFPRSRSRKAMPGLQSVR